MCKNTTVTKYFAKNDDDNFEQIHFLNFMYCKLPAFYAEQEYVCIKNYRGLCQKITAKMLESENVNMLNMIFDGG